MEISTLTLNLRALDLLVVKEDRPTEGDAREDDKHLPLITLDEVSWHDTLDDCWIVVCDYVYDCTDFLKNHPGGPDVLLEYAGRDASLAFIGTGHSKSANRLLKKFLIGELPPHERIFRTANGIKIGTDIH